MTLPLLSPKFLSSAHSYHKSPKKFLSYLSGNNRWCFRGRSTCSLLCTNHIYTVHHNEWYSCISVEFVTSAHSYHTSPKNSSHIFQVTTGGISEEEVPTPYYVQIIFILCMIRNGIPAPPFS